MHMKIAFVILTSIILFSCSSPEERFWESRTQSIDQLGKDGQKVLAMDLDLSSWLSSLDSIKGKEAADRDAALYLHGRSKVNLDTAKYIQDSLLPAILWGKMAPRLIAQLRGFPSDRQTDTLTLLSGATLLKKQLSEIRLEIAAKTNEDHPLLKLFQEPYATSGEVKIPIAVLLVRQGEKFLWLVVNKWNLQLPDSQFLDHFEVNVYPENSTSAIATLSN